MVTRSPFTAMAQVQVLAAAAAAAAAWVRLHAGYGMSSPFTADAWWIFLWGFLPPSEGLKIVLILIGTVSSG